MEFNEQGEVALKYWQPGQVIAADTPTKKDYVFVVKANISLAWINPDDVGSLLSRKAGCNCGGSKKKPAFSYANESDVRRWSNNGGR